MARSRCLCAGVAFFSLFCVPAGGLVVSPLRIAQRASIRNLVATAADSRYVARPRDASNRLRSRFEDAAALPSSRDFAVALAGAIVATAVIGGFDGAALAFDRVAMPAAVVQAEESISGVAESSTEALPAVSAPVFGGEDAVTVVVAQLRAAGGDPDVILQAFVRINEITEDDLDGVMEDTVAKEKLTLALSAKRQEAREAFGTRPDIDFAYGVLKRRLDPWNVIALRPYLGVAPYLGGLLYAGTLAVQQTRPRFFPPAYLAAVAVLVAPGLFLVLSS